MHTRGRACSTTRRLALAWFVLEVGNVIAVTFELKTGGTDLLGKRCLAAFRTRGQRRIAELLHHVFLHTTTAATIFVNRHMPLLYLKGAHYTLPPRIGRSRIIGCVSAMYRRQPCSKRMELSA